MDSFADIASRFQLKKEVKTTSWQFEALEAVKKLNDGSRFKGSIFKCFKENNQAAKIALVDSLELSKPFARYFLKVFSEINKKHKNKNVCENTTDSTATESQPITAAF